MENTSPVYTTRQAADLADVYKDTLLRWLREGRIPEPERDRNGWRVFTPQEVAVIVRYAKGGAGVVAEQQPNLPARPSESPANALFGILPLSLSGVLFS